MKSMYQYHIYGLCLLSDIEFPQLLTVSEEDAKVLPQIIITEAPFPAHLKQDKVCFSSITKEESYLSNTHCYLRIEQGSRIFYERKVKGSDPLLGAYILSWGISMLCYQRGMLALHGSCVAGQGGALLICGSSGSGKSTITKELLSLGFSFLADDISVLNLEESGSISALPAFPYQKLCRDVVERLALPQEELIYVDEKKDKFLVPYKGKFATNAVPVRAIIILSLTYEENVSFEELSGVPKFQACMNSWFLRPLLGNALFAPENGVVGLTLTARVPIYRIARPINKDSKEEIVQRILSAVNQQ